MYISTVYILNTFSETPLNWAPSGRINVRLRGESGFKGLSMYEYVAL